MRLSEFITEGVRKSTGSYGGGAPAMRAHSITPANVKQDTSAPWIKAAIGKASRDKKTFDELATAKEKFDFLYNLKTGKTTNRIRIKGDGLGDYHVQSYNPATGEVTLTKAARESTNTYTGNVNNFTFHGRARNATSSQKTYTFTPGPLNLADSEPKVQTRGRPSKKEYKFPTLPW